jgi:molybdopterin-guanine dinucleotide biosynthesis protein A
MNENEAITSEAPAAKKLREEAAENNGIIEDLQAVAEEHGNLTPADEDVLNKWRKEDVASKLDEAEKKNLQRKALLAKHAGEVADKAVIHTDNFRNVLTSKEVEQIQTGNQAVKK